MSSGLGQEFPVEEEYKKNKEMSSEDIARLREWLYTQPHLPEEHITDLDIALTYHCCEYSSEVSKQVLDLNYTLRTLFTDLFQNRALDDKTKRAFDTVLLTILPTRSPEGYACFYSSFMDRNVKNFVFVDAVRCGFMVIDMWQVEQGTWPGLLLVLDLEGMALGHLSTFDLGAVQHFLYFLQEALLVKMKGLHFINAPPFMDKLLAILKPFMKKELLSMLHIHQVGSTTLERYFPLEGLPDSESKRYLQDNVMRKMLAKPEFFSEESKKRVVESKRAGKPKTVTDFFGSIEGSFKKLDID